MNDPLSIFYSIRDLYITYLETAFRIADPEIQLRRRALLEADKTLCTEPFIEPLPTYRDSGIAINDLLSKKNGDKWLPNFTQAERQSFVEMSLCGLIPHLAANKLIGEFNLYDHQLEMLRRGVGDGTPGIVTSGTGSGKTESFLLPIFAALAKEAIKWPASPNMKDWASWWRIGSAPVFKRSEQFENPNRPKAIRALILYPMNALVEDQMVRMRKALDSDDAHAYMDKSFNGNRIYFGRYTGDTPVSGWLKHPRINDAKERAREKRRLGELAKKLCELEDTQIKAKEKIAESIKNSEKYDESLTYNFPNPLGNEVVSRWDMQATPPDILITNASMLSLMLVREIDENIFAKTREWINSDPDAYFYLVLDELHLIRGSAGTETAYLLRILFTELGLTNPKNHHKLRILGSSASLPLEGSEREQSLNYLWDLFNNSGLPNNASKSDWEDAIVKGPSPTVKDINFSGNLNTVIEVVQSQKKMIDKNSNYKFNDQFWLSLATEFNIDFSNTPIIEIAERLIEKCALLLEFGCFSNDQLRATSLTDISLKIFPKEPKAIEGVSLLIWLRSLSESWTVIFGTSFNAAILVPRFRAHTFLRAIEGLFAAPRLAPLEEDGKKLTVSERSALLFGNLSVDSGVRSAAQVDGISTRYVELIYCECCGTLFFGGKRSSTSSDNIELLPSDPETDTLPERSKEKVVEKRTIEDYALFMPTLSRFWPVGNESLNFDGPKKETIGTWVKAEFDVRTANIKKLPSHGNTFSKIPGWHYVVTQNDIEGNTAHDQVSLSSSGTALPFQCPSCGISYRQTAKSSPLRGFRAGFSKTTQLLSSALIGELKKVDENEKLICFSDSRQDAAHAALDLESGHHNDVRRELIIRMLEQINASKKSLATLNEELALINARMQELGKIENPSDDISNELAEILDRRKNIKSQLIDSSNDSIPLKDILCPVNPQPDTGVGAVLSSLIDKGIHPIDPTGITSLPLVRDGHGVDAHFSWQQMFIRGQNGEWLWRNGPYDALKIGRDEIAENLLQLISETIFNKTYFAVEESGWGYPCLDLKNGETREGLACYDAMLRILSDLYRFIPSGRYEKKNWTKLSDANKKMRDFVKKYCEASGSSPETFFSNYISRLSQSGHDVGKIYINKIFYKPVDGNAPYWRCENCGRVHLHFGGKICTRCLSHLPSMPTGTALELRSKNFLGKRVQNSSGIYRVRAEELTGMTGNQSARLRRFKNIFIQDDDDILPIGPEGIVADQKLDELAKAIDILSVTTTMEVGVDIGSLKAIFQANMPPQRFNYQQRVGRAGRRGQSFSYVLTICRSKSHDLHYFFNPKEITGDPPPPPFLTSNLDQIAIRIASKYWMVKAFKLIKSSSQGEWDGDELRFSPDNHGEFISIKKIKQDKESWIKRIKSALISTSAEKDKLLLLCVGGNTNRAKTISSVLTEDYLAKEIIKLLDEPSVINLGLAEALAEHGIFPMYGMPTRVRKLYIKAVKHQSNDEVNFKSFDRDLDVAIQEFAPGKYLVHDKSRYFTAGYVGSELRRDRSSSQSVIYDSIPDDLGEKRYLVECPVCLSWSRVMSLDSDIPNCECCGKSQAGSLINTTFVPLNFIGSMNKISFKEKSLEEQPSKSSRTSIAEAKRIDTKLCLGTNLKFGVSSTSQIFRLNRGQLINNKWTGFSAKRGNLIVPYEELGSTNKLKLKNTWIDNEAFELDQSESSLKQRFSPYQFNHNDQQNNNFYLCSPKVTDSIIFELNSVNPAIDIMKSQNHSRLEFSSAFRAGAISACYHIVNFASRVKLDVDPDEFEILDPRIQVREDGARIPVLQISDELINGSGLTNRLGQLIHSQPLFLDVINEIMSNKPKSPSFEFMQTDHPQKCLTGCYRCLHRYGNQHYHGLLDWRLGFNILSMFLDANYSAGMDGNYDHPGLSDWERLSRVLAEEASIFLQTQIKIIEGINIVDLGNDIWAGIIHPLWSKNEIFERYSELTEFASNVTHFDFISTFSLSRNMGETLLNFKNKSLDHFSN